MTIKDRLMIYAERTSHTGLKAALEALAATVGEDDSFPRDAVAQFKTVEEALRPQFTTAGEAARNECQSIRLAMAALRTDLEAARGIGEEASADLEILDIVLKMAGPVKAVKR